MATVKYLTQGNSLTNPIYLRLSLSKKKSLKRKTGLFISKNDWNKSSGFAKQNNASNKNLTIDLKELSTFVLKAVNNFDSKLDDLTGAWLNNQIDLFFGRFQADEKSELITDLIQEIINEAPTRKNAKGGIGLSKSRINGLVSLKNIIEQYQKYTPIKVKDVNVNFGKEFLKFLLNEKQYQKSTALKKLADLKTVCNEAELSGIEINAQFKKINSTKPNNENILYLTTEELESIENCILLKESLKNARKWLLLGCSLGQRGGDLLELTETNFINRNGLNVIELKQQKTGKNVTIPVLDTTKQIISSGLPYKISMPKFNKHIKEICRIAGVNQMTDGAIVKVIEKGKGNKEKRKINGVYPKWQLMSSHVCRRSFATNLYGVLPTPLIMQVTAHSSERMLLNYIGKNSLDYAQQIADFYTLQSIKVKKEPQLNIIKKNTA
tara:strand:+ start:239 stop:1552 length:1314 start_codon:yes stop_codon:yes gene_type:complete